MTSKETDPSPASIARMAGLVALSIVGLVMLSIVFGSGPVPTIGAPGAFGLIAGSSATFGLGGLALWARGVWR